MGNAPHLSLVSSEPQSALPEPPTTAPLCSVALPAQGVWGSPLQGQCGGDVAPQGGPSWTAGQLPAPLP